MNNKMEQKLEHNYTEFSDDVVKKDSPQKLEFRGEVYEQSIFRASEDVQAPHSQVLIIELNGKSKDVIGQVLYSGKLSPDELKNSVKEVKTNPITYMFDEFKENYTN